jgi:hypothetical protein
MVIIFWVKGMSLLVGFQLLHSLRILNITEVSDYGCLSLLTTFDLFFSDLHEVGVEFAVLGTETETEEWEKGVNMCVCSAKREQRKSRLVH